MPDEGGERPVADDVGNQLRGKIDFHGFLEGSSPDPDYLVEPVIPRGRYVSIVGKAKAGKSLLALEIAAALAAGRPILGRSAINPMRVLYIDMEMTSDDVRDRLLDLGFDSPDEACLREYLNYYCCPDLPPLNSRKGGEELLKLVSRCDAELVVIDTVSKVIEGEENSNDVWRDLYRHSIVPLKVFGASVLGLDHFGKDSSKGPRGASTKSGDVDVEWKMAVSNDTITLDNKGVSRLPWIPRVVKFDRARAPALTHQWTRQSTLSDRAMSLVRLLDDKGVPTDTGRHSARKMIEAQGMTPEIEVVVRVSTEVWAEVVRYRKARESLSGTIGLKPSQDTRSSQDGKTSQPLVRTARRTAQDTAPTGLGTVTPLFGADGPPSVRPADSTSTPSRHLGVPPTDPESDKSQ